MADAAANDVHHRFDEGELEEEFVVGNRFDVPHFLERLDKQDGHGEAQKSGGQKDYWEVRSEMDLEGSNNHFGREHGTEPSAKHSPHERARRNNTIAQGDRAGPFFTLHEVVDDILKPKIKAGPEHARQAIDHDEPPHIFCREVEQRQDR